VCDFFLEKLQQMLTAMPSQLSEIPGGSLETFPVTRSNPKTQSLLSFSFFPDWIEGHQKLSLIVRLHYMAFVAKTNSTRLLYLHHSRHFIDAFQECCDSLVNFQMLTAMASRARLEELRHGSGVEIPLARDYSACTWPGPQIRFRLPTEANVHGRCRRQVLRLSEFEWLSRIHADGFTCTRSQTVITRRLR
jgi:hypothetical protein